LCLKNTQKVFATRNARVIMIYKHDRSYFDAKKMYCILDYNLDHITAMKRVIWNMH